MKSKILSISLLLYFISVGIVFAEETLNKNSHGGIYRAGSNIQSVMIPGSTNIYVFYKQNYSENDGLYKSDGTEQGTILLHKSKNSIYPFQLIDSIVYFGSYGNGYGKELWRSDGTLDGTYVVKDINPGINGSNLYSFVNLDGILYFKAYGPEYGGELWRSDGTSNGTYLVKDINPGRPSSNPDSLVNINGILFFSADTPEFGNELWRSDGTSSGTYLVGDINPGKSHSIPHYFCTINGIIYFAASGPEFDKELWRSDGTSNGTYLVKDIFPGGGLKASSSPSSLAIMNGALYFSAGDIKNGGRGDLWKSDGTSSGTIKIKDFSYREYLHPMKDSYLNGVFYLVGKDKKHGQELWKSDGTTQGTVLVKEIWPGVEPHSNTGPLINHFNIINGTVYFTAYDNTHPERGIWTTDGTAAGTMRLDESSIDYMILMQIKYDGKFLNTNLNSVRCN